MSWARLELQTDAPDVEVQLDEHRCSAACAAMLLRDRGIEVAQPMIAAGLRQPSEGAELARRLNECSRGRHAWIGGQLDLEPPLRVAHADFLARAGSWAAQLIRVGERDGHWVVVDGTMEQAVAVQHPGLESATLLSPLARFHWPMQDHCPDKGSALLRRFNDRRCCDKINR